MSIALSSGCKPQILHSNLLFSKTHFANHSPNVISFPKPLIFLTQVRISTPVELHPCGRRCSSRRIGSSLLPQDPVLGEGGEEEEDVDGLGNRGSDWGQQDEGSDEESAGFSESGGIKQAFAVPPEGARLFVGNLPFDIGSKDLATVFQQAGVVEIAEVIYNRETNQSRGFGFVSMSTVEEADKAVNIFNGYDLSGRLLNVNKASRRGSQPIRQPGSFVSKRRIFVGNLAWEVDDARLEEFFSEHGKVVEARVVYETDSGRSRGFGFVKMSTDKEVDEAIAHLDGKSLDGRAIRVSVAEERPRPRF